MGKDVKKIFIMIANFIMLYIVYSNYYFFQKYFKLDSKFKSLLTAYKNYGIRITNEDSNILIYDNITILFNKILYSFFFFKLLVLLNFYSYQPFSFINKYTKLFNWICSMIYSLPIIAIIGNIIYDFFEEDNKLELIDVNKKIIINDISWYVNIILLLITGYHFWHNIISKLRNMKNINVLLNPWTLSQISVKPEELEKYGNILNTYFSSCFYKKYSKVSNP